MEKSNLELSKESLNNELETANYVKKSLYGNAGSKSKIENYIIESVLINENQGTCLEWIEKLLLDNNVQQSDIDSTRDKAELQYSIVKRFVDRK